MHAKQPTVSILASHSNGTLHTDVTSHIPASPPAGCRITSGLTSVGATLASPLLRPQTAATDTPAERATLDNPRVIPGQTTINGYVNSDALWCNIQATQNTQATLPTGHVLVVRANDEEKSNSNSKGERRMIDRAFERYLRERGMKAPTVSTRISNCKRVERVEGDLDAHYRKDRLEAILTRLTYTSEDERQGRPPKHQIAINGNVRNGTATLKNAVALYREFRTNDGRAGNVSSPRARPIQHRTPTQQWPEWPQPSQDDLLQLATLLTPLVRFLRPDIIEAVVADNRRRGDEWSAKLDELGIDPNVYLWEGSPCAFPGVRRHAGSDEIVQFRGRGSNASSPPHCLRLDDNDYPKHLWAFLLTGKPFRKSGPPGYQLAHLADHKVHKNRWREEFDRDGTADPPLLFGLYTSAANTAYVPSTFLKPTDFAGALRALLLRKAYELYSPVCHLAPPPLIEKTMDTIWMLANFEWGRPVGSVTNVASFLEYRSNRMKELLENVGRGSV